MSERVEGVVKRGRWIYGATVQADVWVIRQNYFEGPTPDDEDRTPGYPSRDESEMSYYAGYEQKGEIKGSPTFAVHPRKPYVWRKG
jgi:hypothetical protein